MAVIYFAGFSLLKKWKEELAVKYFIFSPSLSPLPIPFTFPLFGPCQYLRIKNAWNIAATAQIYAYPLSCKINVGKFVCIYGRGGGRKACKFVCASIFAGQSWHYLGFLCGRTYVHMQITQRAGCCSGDVLYISIGLLFFWGWGRENARLGKVVNNFDDTFRKHSILIE